MKAIIYQPARTAMQSGRAKTKYWLIQFDQEAARRIDPLMGWTSSADTKQQLQLRFDSREAAVAFCDKHGLPYDIREPHRRKVRPKSYAENFSYYSVRGPGTTPLPRP